MTAFNETFPFHQGDTYGASYSGRPPEMARLVTWLTELSKRIIKIQGLSGSNC